MGKQVLPLVMINTTITKNRNKFTQNQRQVPAHFVKNDSSGSLSMLASNLQMQFNNWIQVIWPLIFVFFLPIDRRINDGRDLFFLYETVNRQFELSKQQSFCCLVRFYRKFTIPFSSWIGWQWVVFLQPQVAMNYWASSRNIVPDWLPWKFIVLFESLG